MKCAPPAKAVGKAVATAWRYHSRRGAILDRFPHHAEAIRLQEGSYRMHHRRELRNKQAGEVLTEQTE